MLNFGGEKGGTLQKQGIRRRAELNILNVAIQ